MQCIAILRFISNYIAITQDSERILPLKIIRRQHNIKKICSIMNSGCHISEHCLRILDTLLCLNTRKNIIGTKFVLLLLLIIENVMFTNYLKIVLRNYGAVRPTPLLILAEWR